MDSLVLLAACLEQGRTAIAPTLADAVIALLPTIARIHHSRAMLVVRRFGGAGHLRAPVCAAALLLSSNGVTATRPSRIAR